MGGKENGEEHTGKLDSFGNVTYSLVKDSWVSIFKVIFKALKTYNKGHVA